jgi:hypothetical protein
MIALDCTPGPDELIACDSGGSAAPGPRDPEHLFARIGLSHHLAVRANKHSGPGLQWVLGLLTRVLTATLDDLGRHWTQGPWGSA